jgi:hypothetical protein
VLKILITEVGKEKGALTICIILHAFSCRQGNLYCQRVLVLQSTEGAQTVRAQMEIEIKNK